MQHQDYDSLTECPYSFSVHHGEHDDDGETGIASRDTSKNHGSTAANGVRPSPHICKSWIMISDDGNHQTMCRAMHIAPLFSLCLALFLDNLTYSVWLKYILFQFSTEKKPVLYQISCRAITRMIFKQE